MPPAPKPPQTRLYVDFPFTQGMEIFITEKQGHYLTHVLRRKLKDRVCVFNGRDGEWLTEIILAERKKIGLKLLEQLRPQKPLPDLWLLAASLRSGKSEWVVEKATELGISRFIPVSTQFTVATSVNCNRLTAIAVEAAEQCERMDIPAIDSLIPLPKLLDGWDSGRKIIYGDESGAGKEPKDLFPKLAPGKYAVLIGPEGGFAKGELELLRGLDYTAGISLGPRILRADTAAVAVVTLVQSQLGDWDNKPAFRNK